MKSLDFATADKESVLQWLQTASVDHLWDRFLTEQTHLQFRNENELFSADKWWLESHDILEIGSGNGEYLSKMAEAYPDKICVGVEKKEESVASSKTRFSRDNLAFLQGDAEVFVEDLAGRFDVVMFRLTLQHLKNPKTALELAYRYLKPQGHLLIIEAYDPVRKSSHPSAQQQAAIEALNTKNSQEKKGNRYISLEILQECLSGGPLSQKFEVEFSNLDSQGLLKAGCKQIMVHQAKDRELYFTHALLFLSILKKDRNIPVDLPKVYDELRVYLDDENAWVQPGMHMMIARKPCSP